MLDRAAVLVDPRVADAEARLDEVADDRLDALGMRPALEEAVELLARVLADEDVHVALAVAKELLDEMAADEAGRAGHEIAHGLVPFEAEVGRQARGARRGRRR